MAIRSPVPETIPDTTQAMEEDTDLKSLMMTMMHKMNLGFTTLSDRMQAMEKVSAQVEVLESKVDNIQVDVKDMKSDIISQAQRQDDLENKFLILGERLKALQVAERQWTDKGWPTVGEASSSDAWRSGTGSYGKAATGGKGAWGKAKTAPGLQFKGQDNLILGGFPKDATEQLGLKEPVWSGNA